MRVALISDIHGNHVALEAVLAHIESQDPDLLICLGDVATIGPQPVQVLESLRDTDCVCLRGNHDDALLRPESAEALNIARPLFSSLHWTLTRLNASDLAFLASFPATHCVTLDSQHQLLCFHGSPQSNTDLILATTPAAELDDLLGPSEAMVLAGGHTHIQMLRQHRGRLVITRSESYRPSEFGTGT